ncbi:MAG: hypothetical protein ACR2JW_06340 [Thermomicrobiales bacterium]
MSSDAPRPSFTGLLVARDLEYRYSFLYPEGWHTFELETTGGRGIIVAPTPDDTANSFSVEARDLGMTPTEEDLPTLREGFAAGLRDLSDAAVEMRDDFAIGTLLGIEATLTYRDGDATRKRWVRLLYQGTTQIRLIAQGATVAEYDYWLPMLTQAMRTFQFADWWAEVTGIEWLPSLDAPLNED